MKLARKKIEVFCVLELALRSTLFILLVLDAVNLRSNLTLCVLVIDILNSDIDDCVIGLLDFNKDLRY